MARTILSVILGYATMVVVTIAGIGVLWGIVGVEGAFQPDSTVASTPWALASCVVGLGAAVGGGWVAAAIGKHPTNLGVKALAGVVVVLGLLLAFMTLGQEPKPLPEGKQMADLSFSEAGAVATSPTWYNFVIPLVGAAGVVLGGGLRKTAPN